MNTNNVLSALLSALVLVLPITAVGQYTNVRVSSTSSTSPEEVVIAINPANPLNLAAGANLNFYYYSTNGGLNWTQGTLSSTLGVWGDPCVVFDATGNLYYGHLSNPSGGSWLDRIVVQKSTNGGAAWSSGVGIGLNPPKDQDKEWIAVDMTNSPYWNRIYVSWTEFDSYGSASPTDSSRILLSRSTDFGQTWSTPVRLSDRGGDCIDSDNTVEGVVPAIGPNGEVYVAWSGPLGIMFDKSTDGGTTFGTDVFVTSQPGGWDFDIPGIYRCNGLPITACDVSNSPYRGTIYVLWSDQRNGINNTDVSICKSSDGGQSWSQSKRVNDDTGVAQQFFPWFTIDQTTGFLYAAFYDRRNTTGNVTEVFVARSTDGGETFQNFRVSASSFTPSASVFFGDYIGIAAHNRMVYPIWARMDGSSLSVWTAIFNDSVVTSVIGGPEIPSAVSLSQNYPNPFNPNTMIRFELPSARTNTDGYAFVSLKVYDVVGKEVATLVEHELRPGRHEVMFDGSNLASGVYCYRLQAGGHLETRKLVLLR